MNQLQAAGSHDPHEGRYASIFTSRFFLGLWTNRNPLRSPAGVIYENFYHLGGTDALIAGTNVEISNRLTICRRPGNTAGLAGVLSSATIPDIPDSFYSFHEIGGTVRVFVDTPTAPYLVTSANVIPIFTKAGGVTQSFFQGIGQSLYISDAKEQQKWLDFGSGVPGNSLSTITNTALTSNVATITAVNNFAVGQTVVISNTTNGSGALNVTGLIASVTPTQFTFNFTHGNIASAADTGFASATWNTGIVAPATPPNLQVVSSGSAAATWTAATYFSTMGIIVDSNGNAEQLISVNANGTNAGAQIGTSSNGSPNWNQTPGGTTTDNTITWTNRGPIGAWAPLATYNWAGAFGTTANPAAIFDPSSNAVFVQVNTNTLPGTTGSFKPNFVNVPGAFINDGSVRWGCIGSPGNFAWIPGHSYTGFTGSLNSNSEVIEPVLTLPAPNNQVVYLQTTPNGGVGGTSASSFSNPPWATVAGQQTIDNQLAWVNLGSATRANTTSYIAWTQPKLTPFGCIKDAANNLQICIQGGVTAGSPPTFETTYGATTLDGTVKWVCVGSGVHAVWTASQKFFLPQAGFNPPQPSDPFGGADIVDSNTNLQFVISSGVSGGGAPAWATTVNATTTDNTITWSEQGPASTHSLSWSFGFGYVYSYKARAGSDPYVLQVPPLGTLPLGPPTGSADGSVSTASPSAQFTGPNPGAVINVSGIGSTDPQVDTIEIYRTVDTTPALNGGGIYFFLTDIPNPAPIGGVAQPWTFQDYMPNQPTSTLPGLNPLIIAPTAHFNDPPLAGLINIVQHLGRVFGSVGATVYCSEGPLVGGSSQPPGNGYTAFNPGQFWTFPSPVVRLVPTTTGLLVFTTSDLYIIAGGPAITSVFSNILIPGLGLTSYNALSIEGGLIYLLTADNQCVSLDPNMGVSEVGFPVGDQLNTFSPANSYLATHIQGSNDKAMFIADGSTGWFRCNPHQAPDSSISGPVWSPKATIVGGAKAIASLEVAPGKHALLIGATTSNQPILVRDSGYATFTDNGTAYPANFTFGSMVLANPGQIAELGFITCEFQKVGTSPKLSILMDELSGSFEDLSGYTFAGNGGLPPQDPPLLYGATLAPATLFANRYYFAQSVSGATPPQGTCTRHAQVKIDFGSTDTVQNEILSMTVFGRHWASN